MKSIKNSRIILLEVYNFYTFFFLLKYCLPYVLSGHTLPPGKLIILNLDYHIFTLSSLLDFQ